LLWLVGFVGYSASTPLLIQKISSFKKNYGTEYWKIMGEIREIVSQLKNTIVAQDALKIIGLLRENRRQLSLLSDASQSGLETPELSLLANIAESQGGAGKFSGAGGGDCGIALTFNHQQAEQIRIEWEKNGIVPISLSLAGDGVKVLLEEKNGKT
jgi:phosphomevalonate kinase